ncbi:MAG: acetolactate synthase small subunit [Candidatus Sumerlaeales bacterium]|nr:acetolactate synthase small subunit [Candidatus Sumerlaeales bacterium]
MEHVISVLVENRFGVLAHIAGVFSGRGYNIESLTVGVTKNPEVSRMTIVVNGDKRIIDQIVKQLNRQIDVIEVSDLTKASYIDRELILVKLSVTHEQRAEVIEIANLFRAKIVDVQIESLTIEAEGDNKKLSALINLLDQYSISDIVRTGRVGLPRG